MNLLARRFSLLGALALVTACGPREKKQAEEESPFKKAKREAHAAVEESAAKVNALVPTELAPKLSFVPGTMRNESGAALVPKGWEVAFEGNYKAPRELGFGTSYWISSNCDGACTPKDWPAIADKVDFAQYGDGWKIAKDEKADGQRVIVAEKQDVHVVVAKWKTGANRYFACRATLAPEAKAAAPAFEAACRGLAPIEWE